MNALLEVGLAAADAALAPLAQALRQRLPAGFVLVAATAQADRPVALAERHWVDAAVPGRRADFITGRWCAHRALGALGRSCDVLAVGPLGGPVWPQGTVGSITHDRGWCMAAVGPRQRVRGIGIDLYAKADLSILPSLSPLIHGSREVRRYARVLRCEHHLRTLFCIKEAVVKAVSQQAGCYLDLRDIDVSMQGSEFEACVSGIPTPVRGWHGASDAGAVALATV